MPYHSLGCQLPSSSALKQSPVKEEGKENLLCRSENDFYQIIRKALYYSKIEDCKYQANTVEPWLGKGRVPTNFPEQIVVVSQGSTEQ